MALQTILSKFTEIIAPFDCIICGVEGDLLCAFCIEEAIIPKTGSCVICNKLSPNGKTCIPCRRRTFLHEITVASRYEGVAKELIHKLKYDSAAFAAKTLAQILAARITAAKYDLVTSVPATAKHRRLRGYDHAELIARAVAAKTKLIYAPVLVRTGKLQQVGASKSTRKVQVAGVFEPKNTSLIMGSRILIIDDVLTTGATLNESARVLKTAGAKRVSAAVAARD